MSTQAGSLHGSSETLGLRYDVRPNIAIKASVERRDPVMLFFDNIADPGTFEQGHEVTSTAIAVDFVF